METINGKNLNSYKGRMGNSFLLAETMKELFDIHLQATEVFIVLCLDQEANLVDCFEASRGVIAMQELEPMDIFRRAVSCGATKIFLGHNHLSGHAEPSDEDILLTEKLVVAGKCLGIKVLDHIIHGDGYYHSFKEKNGGIFYENN